MVKISLKRQIRIRAMYQGNINESFLRLLHGLINDRKGLKCIGNVQTLYGENWGAFNMTKITWFFFFLLPVNPDASGQADSERNDQGRTTAFPWRMGICNHTHKKTFFIKYKNKIFHRIYEELQQTRR